MSEVYEALRLAGVELNGDLKSGPVQRMMHDWQLPTDHSISLLLDGARLLPSFGVPGSRLVALESEPTLAKERFMVLSTYLKHLQEKGPLKTVVLTSGLKGEGKSVIAANLAISLARGTKQRVLLLEGDLRQPILCARMGCGDQEGLSEWLQAEDPTRNLLFKFDRYPLWVLPAGIRHEHPLELLQSPRLRQLVRRFCESFDWIVIDCPPLVPLADASIWIRLADGVLLVVRENETPARILQGALDALGKTNLLAVVLNDARSVDARYYRSYLLRRQGQIDGTAK